MSPTAAQAQTTMSLRQVIELGKQSKPWAFVPIAHAAIAQSGYDPELWFLLAENLSALGLKTLAEQQLDALCQRRPAASNTPVVAELRQRIERLSDDRINPDELIENARRSVDALRARGIDLGEAFKVWQSTLCESESFRASDGNIVRRIGEQLLHFGDQIGAARDIGEHNIAKVAQSHAPFTIEGIDPPWLLIELDTRTPRGDNGYQPGIRVIQADAQEFLDGCSMADVSGILADERVDVFVGAQAAELFAASLVLDAGTPISGPYMPLWSLRTPISPSTADLIRSAIGQQGSEHSEHLKQIHKRDATRDENWWRKRLTDAIDGNTEPLRVLITTCRFTTVLHSMCVDLAESLRKQGCTVELLTEANAHRRLSPLAYSRVIDTLDPDVILAPNYTRRDLEKVITGSHTPPVESRVLPVGVPYVVWVQDAMPHLLTIEAGAAIGSLDIAIGYISLEMIVNLGYPREAVEPTQLVASTHRFNIQCVDTELKNKYTCDVAMMTHHSETPEAMQDRLLDELGNSAQVRRLAESMLPEIQRIANNPMAHTGIYGSARKLINQHTHLDLPTRELLLQNFILKLIDRTLRHESAHWASQICKNQGWSFKIFGKGWHEHPALAQHAEGELPHGEALASAYAAAGLTLHISAFNPLHQRIIECTLSGGCPIIRRTTEAYYASIQKIKHCILQTHQPSKITEPKDNHGQVLWFDRMLSCDTIKLTRLHQLVGKPLLDRISVRDPKTDTRIGFVPPMQTEANPAWLFGDLNEMSYDSQNSLEAVIKLAREYPNWRQSASDGIKRRSLDHFTHDTLATKLINKIYKRAAHRGADCNSNSDPFL